MLSTDASILAPGKTRERIVSYGGIFESVVVIIFSKGVQKEEMIAPNVSVISSGGSSKIAALFRSVALMNRRVRKGTCDVLSAQDPFILGFFAILFGRLRGIPVQIQLHTDCFAKGYVSESPRRFIESFLASFVLSMASCVRAVSKRAATGAMKATNVPLSVLPILVRANEKTGTTRPKEFPEGFTALTVSRLTHEKDIGVLIEAIALLPWANLVIVGDGPMRKSLEEMRTKMNLVERVRFAGWQQDLTPYYEHANCYLQASRYEGYGMSLVEAALSDVPLVSTDVGIVGDIFKSGEEILVAEGSPASFAEHLTRVKEEPETKARAARAKARARETVLTEQEYLSQYQKAIATCV